MIIATINRGAAAAFFIALCAGAVGAVTQPPPGVWGREALGPRVNVPAPSRDALFIVRSIKGPDRGERAEAPLPGLGRLAARDERAGGRPVAAPPPHHERRAQGAKRNTITLAPPAALIATPVPIPAAAPLLFAALGGLALLRRRGGPRREKGASEA
jgi:hypothetical protein